MTDSSASGDFTLHLIGNAHLDPVWLWRWQEGCAEAIGTCWAAIDRLEEGEGFIFTKGEAHIYDWIERLDPDLFARITHFVRRGRWMIVNGWWIQPDCNVPSGESVIRQALYGKRYFKAKFGLDVPAGYNVDSFGHPGTFPMLLRHTGSDSYTFMRPGPHEMDLPAELFDWASPDGSSVTAFRIQGAYNTSKRETPLPIKIDQHYERAATAGHPFMCFYGVGNHGGAPTIENIEEIERRLAAGENLAFSDPDRFYDEVRPLDKPRVEGELQFHAIGCYAVASDLKALNRRAESLLEQAEAAATLAHRETGADYPRAEFEALWRRLLFNQFHDTLGGTSLESACEDSVHELGAVITGAEDLLNSAVRQLAQTIRKSVHTTEATFLVMNFSGSDFDAMVEAEPWVDKDNVSRRVLLDEEGRSIPFQYADPHGKTTGLQRIAFPLSVPAFGYRTLCFAVDDTSGIAAPGVSFGAPAEPEYRYETEGYRLELNPETGAIARLENRADGTVLLEGGGHLATIVEDQTDTWSHGTDRFGTTGETMRLVSVLELENGPVRKVLEVTVAVSDSRMHTRIVLPEDPTLPVELRVRLHWREQRKLLRLSYPMGADRFEYEVPAGWDARPANGREVPGQRWVRAVGEGGVVAIANTAKYSYAAQDGTLYITAIRSPIYAHHDPIPVEPGASYAYMDQGEHRFTIALMGARDVSRKTCHKLAENLNKPPVTTPHVARNGTATHAGQWLDADAGSGVVTALKLAEDLDGAIIRSVNLEDQPATLSLAGATLPIRPRGMVSARLDDAALTEVDGLERPV